MYDQFLSPQWFLDFCFNPFIGIFILVIIPLLVLFAITIFQIKKVKEKKLLIVSLLVSYVSFAFLYGFYFIAYFIGGYITCSMSTFYRGVDPAHAIHAQIKERILQNSNIPESLLDLKTMDPKNYALMIKYAKVNYIYDSKSKTYTFFVRPSRYGLALFDSKNDFKIYNLNNPFPDQKSSIYGGKYPPDYPGPWDKLPK